MSTSIHKRVFEYLDAARDNGAFATSGMFCGLEADIIADEIATHWDAADRGKMSWEVTHSKPVASDIAPHVAEWLVENT